MAVTKDTIFIVFQAYNCFVKSMKNMVLVVYFDQQTGALHAMPFAGRNHLFQCLYPKGNQFEIPLTRTFCGNQVLTKANLSPNKYRIAINTAKYNTAQNTWHGCHSKKVKVMIEKVQFGYEMEPN